MTRCCGPDLGDFPESTEAAKGCICGVRSASAQAAARPRVSLRARTPAVQRRRGAQARTPRASRTPPPRARAQVTAFNEGYERSFCPTVNNIIKGSSTTSQTCNAVATATDDCKWLPKSGTQQIHACVPPGAAQFSTNFAVDVSGCGATVSSVAPASPPKGGKPPRSKPYKPKRTPKTPKDSKPKGLRRLMEGEDA